MYIQRLIEQDIKEYRAFFPALLISGARQTGKSTLSLHLDIQNYITLDDINIYEVAKNNPKGFIESLKKPVIIDEIQRLPELLISIKEYIDKNRKNGEFILTGSANLKGFKAVSDSLAGRIGIVELYPFCLKEKAKKQENICEILSKDLSNYLLLRYKNINLHEHIINGGYPEITKINTQKAKYLWFSSYIRTYIESDAKELANIRNMDKFIKAYKLCMLRSGTIFSKYEIQKDVGLDSRTFDSYFSILEHTYQIQKLQPYFNNALKRLTKTPKIFALDSGLLCHLLQITSTDELNKSPLKGQIVETFIFGELLKALSCLKQSANLYYYRTSDKKEIDFILEFSSKIIAIEIKSSKTINKSDFKHIYSLKNELNKEFDKGIVLYLGDTFLQIDHDMYGVPIGFLS